MALEHEKDTSGYLNINNPTSRIYIKTRMIMNNIVGIWQERNPGKREFTFDKKQKRNCTKASLDYFLLSKNSSEPVTGTSIGRACKLSVHRLIYLQLSSSSFKRGKASGDLTNTC